MDRGSGRLHLASLSWTWCTTFWSGVQGAGVVYVPVMNYVEGNYQAVRHLLVHPLTVPGLGDAGAHSTMICDGGFTTYLLEYWGREAPEAQRLPVEWIVKRQCADTAALVGLNDRGVLAPGKRADINVIYDLPRRTIGRTARDALRPSGRREAVGAATSGLCRHGRRRPDHRP